MEEEDFIFGSLDYTEFKYRVDTHKLQCSCVSILSGGSAVSLLQSFINTPINALLLDCFFDNLIRVFNFCIFNFSDFTNPDRLCIVDLFFRLRHEILFKLFLLSINMSVVKSDTPFSSFGLESNRTPDFIYEIDNVLYIFEISASSNLEKAAMMKGVEEAGFESKYNDEILQLQRKGIVCCYNVVLFDMGSVTNESFMDLYKKLDNFHINDFYVGELKNYRKFFCNLTIHFKDFINSSAAVLFSKIIDLPKDHGSLAFLYENDIVLDDETFYAELTISSHVYSKVSNLWPRIPLILDADKYLDNVKYLPVLDVQSHRIDFTSNNLGKTRNQILNLVNNNDKIGFFKLLKLKIGNYLTTAINSETGVNIVEKTVRNGNKPLLAVSMSLSVNHDPAPYTLTSETPDSFKVMSDSYRSNQYVSNSYDPEYESKIIEMICKFDLNCPEGDFTSLDDVKFLGLMKTVDIDIDDVMLNFSSEMKLKNSFDMAIPLKIQKMKSPFLLPLANLTSDSRCKLDYKNISFINDIISIISVDNPFTTLILNNVKDKNFSIHDEKPQPSAAYLKMKNDRYKLSSDLTKEYKRLYRLRSCFNHDDFKMNGNNYISDYQNYNILKNEVRNINIKIRNQIKLEGIKENIGFVRLPTKSKKSYLNKLFSKEMIHFKDSNKQSTIEGYGLGTHGKSVIDDVGEFLNCCSDIFPLNCGPNDDYLIDLECHTDALLLKELKTKAISDYERIVRQVQNSYIGHAAAFVTRLSHSLLFYSQLSFSSDYIRVDNLGYNNVLLIVRGGKKIFKSKSSKMFRLIYPVHSAVSDLFNEPGITPSSTGVLNINGSIFLMTPWSMLHEDVLNDSVSFYPRVCSFIILNSDPSIDYNRQVRKTLFNVILAFHNRRQTEVFLANMRYILLSTMGDYTGLAGIFNDFVGFNYDKIQCFIRLCISTNYSDYFKKMGRIRDSEKQNEGLLISVGLKHLFLYDDITTLDDLTLMIYSTFLMTKGPYQKNVERANNLKGILKIHQQYSDEIGTELTPKEQLERITVNIDKDGSNYINKLMSGDFFIDDKYCANLGKFADSYYLNRLNSDVINTEWLRILNQPWDSMATSTGLRGDFTDLDDFWGQKGYFVIYKKLSKNANFMSEIQSILTDEDMTFDKKRKTIRSLNEVYLNEVTKNCEYLVFHAVDKKQWRGGREIFVMNIDTKKMQQPIEQFMAFLCKKIENEIISIPSDKRAQLIHHTIFEKDLPLKDILTFYLTLDCTKWAPKSVFVKFAIMILNMTILPNSFKTHFLNYLEKLYKKRVYFNISEVNVLKNNPKYKEAIDKFLIKDDKVNGYYILMPYSWVMGIFNYTSSFMHAFNQRYAAYLINKTSLQNWGEETDLHMLAHSDDSGGRISASNRHLIQRGLILYELNLKCCNHLLSYKKSVIAKFYFEILSVIYIFKQLLALLPKFLGGIRFSPTDKGPAMDMSQSYSKCIEVVIAGADFSTAYLYMKFYSALVWRFYHNKKPLVTDYNRPVQYLGMPDAHPLMVLLIGSDADIVRLIHGGHENSLIILTTFINALNNKNLDKHNLSFKINIKGLSKDFDTAIEDFKDILKSWSIRNVNFKSTPFNFLSFLSKLNDKGFIGALTNESVTRRLSRSYYLRSGNSVITTVGDMLFKDVVTELRVLQTYILDNEINKTSILKHILENNKTIKDLSDVKNELNSNSFKHFKVVKLIHQSQLKLYDYLDNITLTDKEYRSVNRTLKPTHLQILKMGNTFSSTFDAAQMVSFIKEPEFRWALPGYRNLLSSQEELVSILNNYSISIEDIDPDYLLKLIRIHQTKNIKDIYLYSQIGSDVRIIKTYAAILQFIASNSFRNLEIQGLTLKLKSALTDPGYNINEIDEIIYFLNTVINVCLTLIKDNGVEFTMNLRIKEIYQINWLGGSFMDFLNWFKDNLFLEKNFNTIYLQLAYCLCVREQNSNSLNASFLRKCYFYTFIIEQRNRSGWYGKGELLFHCEGNLYKFTLYNDRVLELETNISGKMIKSDMSFIADVLASNGINIYNSLTLQSTELGKMYFGKDYSGDLAIGSKSEVKNGIPTKLINSLPGIILNLDYMFIKHVKENLFLLDEQSTGNKYKIYSLHINKGDMLKVIKTAFEPADFKSKMVKEGYDNFSELIATEVLFDYGETPYISVKDFFDSFQASKLYKILLDDQETGAGNSSKMKNATPKFYPASEGSIIKAVIDYDIRNDTNIVNMPRTLNAEILAIRAEYPEQFSVILMDKMREYYSKLYDINEQDEIRTCYLKLIEAGNKETLHKNLIKLMSYWGYQSLVSTIDTFNFIEDENAYKTIKLSQAKSEHAHLFEKFFVSYLDAINLCILHNTGLFSIKDMDNLLIHSVDLKSLIIDNLISITNSTFNYSTIFKNLDFSHLIFINYLTTFLKYDEFCAQLKSELKKVPVLNFMKINYQNRSVIVSVYNTLKVIWLQKNKQNFMPNYILKNERYPENVRNVRNLLNTFNLQNIPLSQTNYYFGFLSDFIKSNIIYMNNFITIGNEVYKVKGRSVKLDSLLEFPPLKILNLEHMVNEEVFEHDNLEELIAESEMPELDDDTIEELWEDIPEPRLNEYSVPYSKIKNKKVYEIDVKWAILPYCEGRSNGCYKIRQIGEVYIILGNCIIPEYCNIPNTIVKRVNYTKISNEICRDMIAYCHGPPDLNPLFFDYLLGTSNINLNQIMKVKDVIMCHNVITNLGITPIDEVGVFIQKTDDMKIDLENKKEKGKIKWGDETGDDNIDQAETSKTSGKKLKGLEITDILNDDEMSDEAMVLKAEMVIKRSKAEKELEDYISDYISRNIITEEIGNRIRSKYLKELSLEFPRDLEFILKSMDTEFKLIGLMGKFEDKSLRLSKKEHQKIFLSPEHFGLSHGFNKPGVNTIKDGALHAELESLATGMANKIASSCLYITDETLRYVKSQKNLLKREIKYGRYKMDNKRFFFKILEGIINNAVIVEKYENDVEEKIWHELMKNLVILFGDDEDDDEDDDVELNLKLRHEHSSRLKYKIPGL